MPISVIVGGQFGSEGKGKVAHFIARHRRVEVAVRVGGPNSGHTVVDEQGRSLIFRHLPTAAILPNVISAIPAGSYLNVRLLLEEIARVGNQPGRVMISPEAWIVTEDDVRREASGSLVHSIGSTGSGTGAAVSRRAERRGSASFAKDVPELRPYLGCTTELLVNALSKKQRILVEGTQGFGLSLLHSGMYPYCTSRDTTAGTFIAEAGLSPIDVDEIVMVLRTFPIRVAGNSGPLDEIGWNAVTQQSGSTTPLSEYTSVTNRLRRVGRFNREVVLRAIRHNRPTCIAVNHLDYVDSACSREDRISQRALEWLRAAEESIGARIALLGYSPSALVWRDVKEQRAQSF